MGILQSGFSFYIVPPGVWSADWAWGLPLIALTVIIHVLCLGLMNQSSDRVLRYMTERHHPTVVSVVVMGATTLLATALHGLEAALWAAAYWFLGAMPDVKTASLYSLNAITSYGHEGLFLEPHWRLMGAIEALNGWLLFGLTTAFLFAMTQRVWLLKSRAK